MRYRCLDNGPCRCLTQFCRDGLFFYLFPSSPPGDGGPGRNHGTLVPCSSETAMKNKKCDSGKAITCSVQTAMIAAGQG